MGWWPHRLGPVHAQEATVTEPAMEWAMEPDNSPMIGAWDGEVGQRWVTEQARYERMHEPFGSTLLAAAHAPAGASAFFRPASQMATPRTKRPIAIPCDVERSVPGTVPLGSPRKSSTTKRRIAAPTR